MGLRADWGNQMRFGDLHFSDLLTFHRIVGATPPYSSWSLNSDMVWHFDDRNAAHYDLANAKYVVAPRSWTPPDFLRPLKVTRRYTLYEAPTRGYGELIAVSSRDSPPSQSALFFRNKAWFLGEDPGARRFVRHDFPPGAAGGSAVAADSDPAARARPVCPGGRASDERVSPGRIELRVDCPAASTLALKVTYHPNWRVTVDGQEATTFMVSPSFIGVELPPGAHQVSAEYRSGRLKRALLALGALTLIAVVVFRGRFAQLERLWASRA